MSASRRGAVVVLLAATLALAAGPAWAQCAMCQTALTGSPEGREMTRHLNSAILLMFVAPYMVLGTFLLVAFRERVRAALARRLGSLRARIPSGVAVRLTLP